MNRDGSISDNTLRGDLISSIPVTLTINVQPINDPPIVDPAAEPLAFSIVRGRYLRHPGVTVTIPVPALLDPFFPGPNIGATDESADIAPRLGGNQTVSLGSSDSDDQCRRWHALQFSAPAERRDCVTHRVRTLSASTRSSTPWSTMASPLASTVYRSAILASPQTRLLSRSCQSMTRRCSVVHANVGKHGRRRSCDGFQDWATNVQAGPTTAIDEINGIGFDATSVVAVCVHAD